jgi:hypothetical protein
MRRFFVVVVTLVLAGCGGKKDNGGGGTASGTGSSAEPKPVEKPMNCPAGNVVQDGKCVAVVTAEKVEAVAKQQTRLDDLAKTLDKLDSIATVVELVDGLRKIDAIKKALESTPQTKQIDAVLAELNNGVKTMRTFKAGLGETATRLGNLKGELDKMMKETGAAKQLAEARAQISSQLKAALEPLANQAADVIKNALGPLGDKLEEIGAGIDVVCGSIRLTGGADAKDICKKAQAGWKDLLVFLEDFKTKPAKLVEEVYSELQKQLDQLIDAESKKLLDAAQAKVNEALKLPAGSGSGSAK